MISTAGKWRIDVAGVVNYLEKLLVLFGALLVATPEESKILLQQYLGISQTIAVVIIAAAGLAIREFYKDRSAGSNSLPPSDTSSFGSDGQA